MLFAMILLLVIWLLQVFFLYNYYEEMKVANTGRISQNIELYYQQNDFATMEEYIREVSHKNDMTIIIQKGSGETLYSPFSSNNVLNENNKTETGSFSQDPNNDTEINNSTDSISEFYREEMSNLKNHLINSGLPSFHENIIKPDTDITTQAYVSYLEVDDSDSVYLYIFSPLYPLEGTIDILTNQLIYVTIISIAVALIIAYLLSKRIIYPIEQITETAEELAKGRYGAIFEGGNYSELSRLADTLTYTSLELAKAENIQKDLIANVSHDLRTPLTMVTSYAEMIRDLSGNNPEKRKQHLQVIIDEAERLNQMVIELLEFSKMQSGKEGMNFTDFSLKSTIESILQSYTGFAEKEGYKLIFISEGEGIIRADEMRIQQVITNLVSNSFKYSGKDKTVEVKMLDAGDYVRCEISDHGIGIPKKDLKHIWERYYKASSNRKRRENTGLGLSIVKEILILHNAKFGVQSALKKGSTFWFEIKKIDDSSGEISDTQEEEKTIHEKIEETIEDRKVSER